MHRNTEDFHASSQKTPLDERSRHLRRLVVRALEGGGRGHVGSSMSLIEIMRVLYDDIVRFRPDQPGWPLRDRVILSKGHGCLAQYALLADKGFFDSAELDTFCQRDSILGGHPDANKVPGVETSTGALGHGLSVGLGMALAAKMQRRDSRLHLIRTRIAMAHCFINQREAFCDERRVPQATVLAFEDNDRAIRIEPCLLMRMLQQQKRSQTHDFRFARKKTQQQPRQSDRFLTQHRLDMRAATARGVAFVEDQIYDRRHGGEPL